MSCPNEERLLDWMVGEGDDPAAVGAHVEECPRCRAFLDEHELPLTRLRLLVERDEVFELPPPALRGRILAALATVREVERGWLSRLARILSRPLVPVLAGAAALAVVGLALLPAGVEPERGPGIGPAVVASTMAFLQPGDRLQLAAGERAVRNWRGMGSLELVGPLQLVVQEAGVELVRGRLTSRVKPGPEGFYVEAPHATALVVGTVFTVETGDAGTAIAVAEGKVRVVPSRAGGETVVLVEGDSGDWSFSEAVIGAVTAGGSGTAGTAQSAKGTAGAPITAAVHTGEAMITLGDGNGAGAGGETASEVGAEAGLEDGAGESREAPIAPPKTIEGGF